MTSLPHPLQNKKNSKESGLNGTNLVVGVPALAGFEADRIRLKAVHQPS